MPPPGLYPDPDPKRAGQLRYWDGTRWTRPFWTWRRIALGSLLAGLMWIGSLALYVCVAGDYAEPPTRAEREADDRLAVTCVAIVGAAELVFGGGLVAVIRARRFEPSSND